MIAQNMGVSCCETVFFRLFNVNIVRIKPILKWIARFFRFLFVKENEGHSHSRSCRVSCVFSGPGLSPGNGAKSLRHSCLYVFLAAGGDAIITGGTHYKG
jgi:hypothetical protein